MALAGADEAGDAARRAAEEATPAYTPAEVGALAHLYRAEVYRSTVWRSRLDATTNWAVVTTGIALSVTFATAEASPLPMLLAGLLVLMFLGFEARRYRDFDVWRVRGRVLETQFYAPMLLGEGPRDNGWHRLLAEDYRVPRPHIGYAEAIGFRLRRNYSWLLVTQAVAYYGKLAVHPTPLVALADLPGRAAVGPIPGWLVILAGVLFHGGLTVFALLTLRLQTRRRRLLRTGRSPDAIRDLVVRRS